MTRPIHPLTGADPVTLARLFAGNGAPRPRYLHSAAGMVASALLRSPNTLAERAYVAAQARRRARMPAPVFILGHWRSGTTHLFNLLSSSPQFAYAPPVPTGIPWDFMLLGRALRPLLNRAVPSDRHIDAMAVTKSAPQEDEIALASMTSPSFFHGIYFPRHLRRHMAAGLFFDGCEPHEIDRWKRALRLFTEKISMDQGDRQVLIKNPAHTAKIQQILEIWPEAKFVHIVRNPYHVYRSTERMFTLLLEMVALQNHDTGELETAIRESYPRMMDQLAEDARTLPPRQFVEVRYEDLDAAPLEELTRIVDSLALDGRDELLTNAKAHLDEVSGHRKAPPEVSETIIETVETHWSAQVAAWGYRQPGRADT